MLRMMQKPMKGALTMIQDTAFTFAIDTLWTARPPHEYLLQVLGGRAWVTLKGCLNKSNPDHVLLAQDTLKVPAGQHLVVESWPRYPSDVLTISWRPVTEKQSERRVKSPTQALS